MSTTPAQINEVGSFLTKLVSMLVTQAAAPAIEKFAEAEFPLLDLPVIKQVFEYSINELSQKISLTVQDGVISIVVNVETASELHGVLAAAINLNKAKSTGDANEISKATQDAIDAWGNAIHWDGLITTK